MAHYLRSRAAGPGQRPLSGGTDPLTRAEAAVNQ
jgi:hypothetical protein